MATFVVFIVERPENNILVIFYAEMGGVIVLKKIKREDLTIGEHERLIYPSVFTYLTRNNKPTRQEYYRTDDGEVWEISHFENEKSEEFKKRMDALEYLSNKLDLAESFGVL